jgi:hypothetical protein
MDYVGVFAKVSKSARASSGGVAAVRLLTTVRIAVASVLGSLREGRERRSRRGRGPPLATCARATSGDGVEWPAHDLRRIVMRPRGWKRPLRGICEDHRRGHPSPLVVDPTRVHAALSEPCGPGTFQNAPQDPCCVRGLSCALDDESRGRPARRDRPRHPRIGIPYPPDPPGSTRVSSRGPAQTVGSDRRSWRITLPWG